MRFLYVNDNIWLRSSYNEKCFKQKSEKQHTHTLYSITFSRKSCDLVDNVVKYGTAGQATDDNIIWRMRFAFQINKAANTHSEYVTLISFPQQQFF
jgi:hypothetical protein